jgi:hypothetical protein
MFPILHGLNSQMVPSCENLECIQKTREIIDAKRRVSLTFPIVQDQTIVIKRSSGIIDDGFTPSFLRYSCSAKDWVVTLTKRVDNTKLTYVILAKDILILNCLVLTLEKNIFIDMEFVDEINKLIGNQLFV